jgi:hypothetical protein
MLNKYEQEREDLKQQARNEEYREHCARMQEKHDGWTPNHEANAISYKMSEEQMKKLLDEKVILDNFLLWFNKRLEGKK